MTLVMIVHLVLTLLNLLIILMYLYSTKSSFDYDVSGVLNKITEKDYEFSEWALVFVFLFVIAPSTSICMILISFKVYTHDFIKPIQKSYLTVVHSYFTCLMFCKLLSDFLLKITYRPISSDIHALGTYIVIINLLTFFMFFILFVPSFFLIEAKLASHLNSVPIQRLGLLKKNISCILFSTSICLCYLLYVIRICRTVSKFVDSCLFICLLSLFCAFLTNGVFYFSYLRMMHYYSNIYTRIYRDYIAV